MKIAVVNDTSSADKNADIIAAAYAGYQDRRLRMTLAGRVKKELQRQAGL